MVNLDNARPEDTFRARQYLGVLRLRKWSIMLATLLALMGALFYASRQTPIYRSQARVLSTNPLGALQTNAIARADPSTEKSLAESSLVLKCAGKIIAQPTGKLSTLCSDEALAAAETPNLVHRNLSVTVEPDSTVLLISYASPSPAKAQAVAEGISRAYVYIRTSQAEADLARLRAPVDARIQTLNKQIAQLNTQIADAIANDLVTTLASLNGRLNGLNNALQDAHTRLLEIDPSKINPPQVLTDAALPNDPVSPNKPLIAAAGFFVGLAFGIALAFVRELFDDRLQGRSDLESKIGAPVFAVIPRVPGWKRRAQTRLITLDQPKSAVSEAYRTLRTSIIFTATQRPLKVLMVCSPSAGEGKTTTATNLAVVLADANKRVILVSADLRKPRVHAFFNLTNNIGLSAVLAGQAQAWDALQDPKVENLRIMASGPIPSGPAELLQSEQMGELLADLRKVADFIVLDTPPVLLVADALALAPLVDGILIVADAEATSRGAISHTREQLEQVDAPVIGAVFNNFDPAKARAYSYYGYGYGYSQSYRYGKSYGSYGETERENELLRRELSSPDLPRRRP
jgi:succinoglycan biosynthesis transport protein ExoP